MRKASSVAAGKIPKHRAPKKSSGDANAPIQISSLSELGSKAADDVIVPIAVGFKAEDIAAAKSKITFFAEQLAVTVAKATDDTAIAGLDKCQSVLKSLLEKEISAVFASPVDLLLLNLSNEWCSTQAEKVLSTIR